MIKIKNIEFAYHTELILKDLNVDFGKGLFSTIIGPNGSGKTTLMNLLTKHKAYKTGSIHINKQKIESYSIESFAKVAAVISQNEQIKFPFTCLDVILMGRKPHIGKFGKYNDDDFEIVHDVMELTDTLCFQDTLVTEISGGEFQRVMLAQALAQEPEILFLDEAFSAMDLAYKLHFLRLIKKLVEKKNMTVISVMHDLNLAYRFSDTICVMKDGIVDGIGQPCHTLTEGRIKSVFGVDVEYIPEKGFLFL